jgi:hypothetical protein
MATKYGSRGTRPYKGSLLKPGAVLISIYLAMYLAVWLLLRALTSSVAAASIEPPSSMSQSATDRSSVSQVGVDESSLFDLHNLVLDSMDDPPQCKPSAAIGARSLYD